jgi:hypothetical protein
MPRGNWWNLSDPWETDHLYRKVLQFRDEKAKESEALVVSAMLAKQFGGKDSLEFQLLFAVLQSRYPNDNTLRGVIKRTRDKLQRYLTKYYQETFAN